ncbi:hypothetical protein ACHQM5_002698 [Ranunculus cassubicifolius]
MFSNGSSNAHLIGSNTPKSYNNPPREHTQVTESTCLSNEKEGKRTTQPARKHLAKHISGSRDGFVNERLCAYFMLILVRNSDEDVEELKKLIIV